MACQFDLEGSIGIDAFNPKKSSYFLGKIADSSLPKLSNGRQESKLKFYYSHLLINLILLLRCKGIVHSGVYYLQLVYSSLTNFFSAILEADYSNFYWPLVIIKTAALFSHSELVGFLLRKNCANSTSYAWF